MANDKRTVRKTRSGRQVLVEAEYRDDTGRKWRVLVPQGQEENAGLGIVLGPPDTSELGLPDAIDIRLNNQLYDRGLIRRSDIRANPMGVFGALQSALRIDVAKITNLYREVKNADTKGTR